MKTIKTFLLSVLTTTLFLACSKSDDPVTVPAPTPITYDIKGYYKGTTASSTSIILLIEDGGNFTLIDGANFYSSTTSKIGYGTGYTIVNNVFTGTFRFDLGTGAQYTISATYNPTTGALTNGTVGAGTNPTGHTTWTAQRTINTNSNPVGLWYGKYNSIPSETDPVTFTKTYTMLIEDATHFVVVGQLNPRISGSTDLGFGTYTTSGSTFNSTYKYNFGTGLQYSSIGNYNITDGKLTSGTWGNTTNTSGGGNWYLNKQP